MVLLAAEIASRDIKALGGVDHAEEEFDNFFAFVFVLDVGLDDGLAGEDKPPVLTLDLDVDEGNVDADEYALSGLHNLLQLVFSLEAFHNHDRFAL